MKKLILLALMATAVLSCKKTEVRTIGTIERIDPAFDALVSADATVEIIAEGFKWSEGPLWLPDQNKLIWSDVPRNIIYQWSEGKDTSVYVTPSGYTGSIARGGEMGSNGLTLTRDGKLALAQHGDRRIAVMTASLSEPRGEFTTIADRYNGKKLNSPNDVIFRSNGDAFFTDPPYGLPNQENDTTRELNFQGVFKATPDGKVSLITDSLTRPNGIAFLPGEKTLIIANSDPDKAIWYAFDLTENDSVTNARIFYDATPHSKQGEKGLPDGFKVDKAGNVYASGPGGIWIFNATGKVLGKIKLSEPTSNCALSPDEKTLYVTNNMYVLRIKLR